MKLRLNRAVMDQMPAELRAMVSAWRAQYGRAFISVENRDGFTADEDSRVTLINLDTKKTASAQVAGDFSGMTQLSPTANIPLAPGVVAVETGFFLGVPFLNVFQYAPKSIK